MHGRSHRLAKLPLDASCEEGHNRPAGALSALENT